MAERPPRPSVDEAIGTIFAALTPLGGEIVRVADALGRIAAAPATAAISVPRFEASAMDGFALRHAETAGATEAAPVRLALEPIVAAGRAPAALRSGRAVPIATGAALPAGADCVLSWEAAQANSDCLTITAPVARGRNVRSVGEDVAADQVVLGDGQRIGADAIGLLLACGTERITVRRRPALALLSTGDELSADAHALGSVGIIDCNGPMIVAAAAEMGLSCTHLGQVPDSDDGLDAALDRMIATSADLLMTSGGVSAGRFDIVRARLEGRGGRVLFHGVRMRPGKPLLFALLPDGRPFFGLPGNPVAALVAFRFFVVAAVRRLLDLSPELGEVVSIGEEGRPGTSLFLRCRRTREASGAWRLDTDLDQRSHILRTVMEADAWLRIDGDGTPVATLFDKWPRLP